jgi:hypothetical protein
MLDNRLHKSIVNNTLRQQTISHLINAGSSPSSSSSSLLPTLGWSISFLFAFFAFLSSALHSAASVSNKKFISELLDSWLLITKRRVTIIFQQSERETHAPDCISVKDVESVSASVCDIYE